MKKSILGLILALAMILVMIPVTGTEAYAVNIISDINIEYDPDDIGLNTYWTHEQVNERVKQSVSASAGVDVDPNNTYLEYEYSSKVFFGIGDLLTQKLSVEKEYAICVTLYPANGYDWPDSVKAESDEGLNLYVNGVELSYYVLTYNAYYNNIKIDFSIGYADVTPIVANVTINESDCTLQRGGNKTFSGVVDGSVSDKTIKWLVEGNTSANTTINASTGKLSVGIDETATLLTVRATANADTEKSATVKVTVSGEVPYISSVSVGPECSLYPGEQKQFTTNVRGTQEDKRVIWDVYDAESPDTSVSDDGLLTVAADETASTIRVRATALQDETKYGEVTVALLEKVTVNEVNLINLTPDPTYFTTDVTEGEVDNVLLYRLCTDTTGVSVDRNNSGLYYKSSDGTEIGIGDGNNQIDADKEYYVEVSLQPDRGYIWGPGSSFKVYHSGVDITEACSVTYHEASNTMICKYKIGKPGVVLRIKSVDLSSTSYTYDGKTHKPSVTVKDNAGNTLVKDTDYTVVYENSASNLIGTYDVTVKPKGDYIGEITKTYSIKTPETAPAISKFTNVSTGVKIEWSKVEGADGYALYRDGSKIKTMSGADTLSYTDTGANTSGTKYGYKIKAYYKGKDGAVSYGKYSETKYTKYIGRAEVTLSNATTGVKVSWKKVTGATGYYVYLNGEKIKTITDGSTISYTCTDANVNGTRYAFKVRAYRTETDGTKYLGTTSSEKKIYFLKRQTISGITSASAGTVKVTCTKNSSATHYQIMYSRDKSFPSSGTYKYETKTIAASSGVSTSIKSLTAGKTYYFKVRSYKKMSDGTINYGSWSAVKSIKVKS